AMSNDAHSTLSASVTPRLRQRSTCSVPPNAWQSRDSPPREPPRRTPVLCPTPPARNHPQRPAKLSQQRRRKPSPKRDLSNQSSRARAQAELCLNVLAKPEDWFAIVERAGRMPAPRGRDMIAQHAAAGGVLGRRENDPSPARTTYLCALKGSKSNGQT